MSGVYVSQTLIELGFTGTPGQQVSQTVLEVGFLTVDPGRISIHSTQLSTGSSWNTGLDAERMHMERDEFLALHDTPALFTGSATKAVIVNDDEDALVFGDLDYIYQRVGEAVSFFSPTGRYWKIPEGSFRTGSVGVAIDGAVQIPGVDYDEQHAVSGTFEFYQSPPTGARVVAWWGV